MDRWKTVGDEAEQRIRVEGVVLVQRWGGHLDPIELDRLEPDVVGLWVLIQLGPLDEDVGATIK